MINRIKSENVNLGRDAHLNQSRFRASLKAHILWSVNSHGLRMFA